MDEFNYFNSGNSGYRGSFGQYEDSDPVMPGTPFQTGMQPPRKKKKRGGAAKVIALVLVCTLAGGSAGVGGAYLYQRLAPASGPQAQIPNGQGQITIQEGDRPQVETILNANNGQPMTPEQLYAANLASCVGITVNTTQNIWGQTTTSAASGSGFVLSQDGYIATNYHVIEEAAEDESNSVTIEVSFANGSKYNAKLVGGEKDNDVAVIKIEATGLTPVTLGDSSRLVVGESVYAIGNPLGELTYSLTDGLISALDRLITTTSTDKSGRQVSTTLNVFQTNCAINPGNSGGPLFDRYGNVIGITTAKYTQSSSGVNAEGLGFVLPINDVKNILTDLIEHGYVTGKPYMGVQVTNVSSDAQRYGISAGAAVSYVAEGSCAQKAGLQVNDIIIAIDNTAIDSSSALTAALSTNYKAGDTATLTIIRDRSEKQLTITFDEKNAKTEANNQPQEDVQQPSQGGGYYYQWPYNMFPW